MKRLYIKYLLLLLIYGGHLRSQNLVLNPGFEQHTSCPPHTSEVQTPTTPRQDYLMQCGTGWEATTYGSSDYFNTCNQITCNIAQAAHDLAQAAGVPDNFFGSAYSDPGETTNEAYAGVYSSTSSVVYPSGWREYITGQLTTTLTANKYYKVSFRARLAQSSTVASRLGAFLSANDPQSLAITGVLSAPSPSFESPGFITDVNMWNTYTKVLKTTPAGGEKFITLGCFSPWVNGTNYIPNSFADPTPTCHFNTPNLDYSYHYIDNVKVEDCCNELNIGFPPAEGGDAEKCCFNITFGAGPCAVFGIRLSVIGETALQPSSIISTSSETVFSHTGPPIPMWTRSTPALHSGELIGGMCISKMPGNRMLQVEFIGGDDGNTAICAKEIPMPNCICDCEKMHTIAKPRLDNHDPNTCCWDITLDNAIGGCIPKSAKIYTLNPSGVKNEMTTVEFSHKILPGESTYTVYSNYCQAKSNPNNTLYVKYFSERGAELCEIPVTLPPCCDYDCTKLIPLFTGTTFPGSNPGDLCCWNMKVKNNQGSNIYMTKVEVFEVGNGVPLLSWNNNGPPVNPQQPSDPPVDVGDFCYKAQGDKVIKVKYSGKACGSSGGEIVCEATYTLVCPCCNDTKVVAVPNSTNPCCKDIYLATEACPIYDILVDAPNTIPPINHAGGSLPFPRLIGTFCNSPSSSNNNTVTIRLKDLEGDTICTKKVEINCNETSACCGLSVYLVGGYNPGNGCACQFDIIVHQTPNTFCPPISEVRLYSLQAGELHTVALGNAPIVFGQYMKIGDICVPFPTDPVSPTFVPVKIYIEFIDANGNVCGKLLTETCNFLGGRMANMEVPSLIPGNIEEQTDAQLHFSCLPNPFSSETIFSYSLDKQLQVKLELFDSQGRLLETLENASKAKGIYKTKYTNQHLPKGLYIAKLTAGSAFKTIKVIIE